MKYFRIALPHTIRLELERRFISTLRLCAVSGIQRRPCSIRGCFFSLTRFIWPRVGAGEEEEEEEEEEKADDEVVQASIGRLSIRILLKQIDQLIILSEPY